MRRIITAVIALFAAVGMALAVPSAAQAQPTACTMQGFPGTHLSVGVSCAEGTGGYRIVMECNWGQQHNSPNFPVYGAWRNVGEGWSTATCGAASLRNLYVQYRS